MCPCDSTNSKSAGFVAMKAGWLKRIWLQQQLALRSWHLKARHSAHKLASSWKPSFLWIDQALWNDCLHNRNLVAPHLEEHHCAFCTCLASTALETWGAWWSCMQLCACMDMCALHALMHTFVVVYMPTHCAHHVAMCASVCTGVWVPVSSSWCGRCSFMCACGQMHWGSVSTHCRVLSGFVGVQTLASAHVLHLPTNSVWIFQVGWNFELWLSLRLAVTEGSIRMMKLEVQPLESAFGVDS